MLAMSHLIVLFLLCIAAWFAIGVLRKLAYAAKVERAIEARHHSPSQLQNAVGKARYGNGIYYLKRTGCPPADAAALLVLYIAKGYPGAAEGSEELEKNLLQILGLNG